jgi:hypothetical protein
MVRNNGHEKMTADYITCEPKTGYHVSDSKIKKLIEGEAICLYPEIPNSKDAAAKGSVTTVRPVYAITIPKNSWVTEFGENEFRTICDENTTIKLIGHMETIWLDEPEIHWLTKQKNPIKVQFRALKTRK